MYDDWTGPTRRSIINFLTYYDRKILFHKSIDASNQVHDTSYVLRLMQKVINQVEEHNTVQLIIDNGPRYMAAGQILIQRR